MDVLGGPIRTGDASAENHACLRLLKNVGIVSVQLTVKTAGVIDTSVSRAGATKRQIELRFVYGMAFLVFGRHGFFEVKVAQHWISGLRAEEIPVDLTLGLRVTKWAGLFLQSFNAVADGNAPCSHGYHRVHKISLSVVANICPRICLETGGYMAVAG